MGLRIQPYPIRGIFGVRGKGLAGATNKAIVRSLTVVWLHLFDYGCLDPDLLLGSGS